MTTGAANYTAQYSSQDGVEAGTDVVVGFIVAIAGFIALIGLIWVIAYLKKKAGGFL